MRRRGFSGVVSPPPPFNNCQPVGATYDSIGKVLSGYPIPTQCMSYDTFAANTNGAVVALHSESNFGAYALRIYDPAGVRPEIQIMPGEDIVSALQAAGMSLNTADQGLSYEYNRLFNANVAGKGGQYDPATIQAQTDKQLLVQGWTQQNLNDLHAGTGIYAPYVNG